LLRRTSIQLKILPLKINQLQILKSCYGRDLSLGLEGYSCTGRTILSNKYSTLNIQYSIFNFQVKKLSVEC
jgi:hypothetical protein